jgi:hypothetical protein
LVGAGELGPAGLAIKNLLVFVSGRNSGKRTGRYRSGSPGFGHAFQQILIWVYGLGNNIAA